MESAPTGPDSADDLAHGVALALPGLLPSLATFAVEVVPAASDASNGQQPTSRERALEARRLEFDAGRRAANRALTTLGLDPGLVARGHRGQPVWPAGTIGSITHAAGVAVAVTARASPGLVGIGIDVAVIGSVDDELWSVLFTERERRAWADPVMDATVGFAAKEAAFKAMFPTLRADLDFREAEAIAEGAHTVRVVADEPPLDIPVRWRSTGKVVVVAAAYVS